MCLTVPIKRGNIRGTGKPGTRGRSGSPVALTIKKVSNLEKNVKSTVRPFLIQSDLSVENGLFRPKPKSSFLNLYTVEKKRAFSTQFFSTEKSDWRIQSKISVEKVYTCFLNRSHRPSHHQTHTHTATRPHTHIRYHTAVSYKALTLAWLSLLLLLAASQRGALLVPLASSVYHTTAAARGIDPMLPTTAASAVALAALG